MTCTAADSKEGCKEYRYYERCIRGFLGKLTRDRSAALGGAPFASLAKVNTISTSNRLLDSLSLVDCEKLLSRSKAVLLPQKTVLCEPRQRPAFAYFLTSGMLSSVYMTANGQSAEVAVTGREGVVNGVMVFGPAMSATQGIIQIAAAGYRIALDDLRNLFHSSEAIRSRLLEFVQNEAVASTVIAGCHRLHTTEKRFAHWLLMVHDRVGTDDLRLTQTFLALMLGSGRPTLTLAAGALQRRGLLELHRGRVTVLDWSGMETAACECYGVTRKLLRDLYINPVSRPTVSRG